MPSLPAAPLRLDSLTQWLNAPLDARKQALQGCLDRIDDLDPSVHAWVQVSPQESSGHGPLSGVPFGAKDIMETRGLATEYGSPIYQGRVGTNDAAIVSALRNRGAILLGKTQTTAFAYITPALTRNPRNLAHTPGGSSSGSAAAVAAGMVPFALGTQTKGSVLRPASYCGVTGFKASYGLLSLEGVLPFARSLDTLGFFTHSATDMLALWEAMGYSTGLPDDVVFGTPDPPPDVEPEMATAFLSAMTRLRKAGLQIRPIAISRMLAKLNEASTTVMFYEGARFHQARFAEHGAQLQHVAGLVRDGLEISVERYDEACGYIAKCREDIGEAYKSTPVILVPAATGPAPHGLTSTGDPRMNAPWTALGTPAISIPLPVANGLPLGLQLTAEHGQDALVIRVAVRVQEVLASRG